MFTNKTYAKPHRAVYIPAIEIDFVTDMKQIPIYILVMFAAVKYHGEVLMSLSSSARSLIDKTESEKSLHFPEIELCLFIKSFCILFYRGT